ncbi:MAG: phosphoglycerate kinase [bacterium]|nr:phosphoglycerate kinase [bacterium]
MKTIRDFSVQGKRVLVRCDFNVPLDARGDIVNDFRIAQSLPTIRYLLEKGARVVLMSHLGEPDETDPKKYSLSRVREALSLLLGKEVESSLDCVGLKTEKLVSSLKEGEALLLENLRFHKGEKANDEAFAKQLASLGEIFINDAFSASHRAHASIVGVPKFLPSGIGFLMEKELSNLESFSRDPRHPFVVVVGGRKVKDKLSFIDEISQVADSVLLGNLVAKEVKAEGVVFLHPEKIVLPLDGNPPDLEYDIGPETEKLFLEKLKGVKSVFWAGPLGMTHEEEYAKGSLAVAKAILASKAFAVGGGGNLSAFLGEYGLRDKFAHVSTGGGASLAFLAREELPGLKVLGYYEEDHGNQESSKGGLEAHASH